MPGAASSPIRVLVVDDQALLRGSFRFLVESAPGMIVVGEAANGTEAIRLACDARPDVVLMDVRMPEVDGIQATREICVRSPARVLILTMFDLDEFVYAALRAGASGFLLKDTPPAELLSAITVVARGDACSPRRSPGGSSPTSRAARRPLRRCRPRSMISPSGNARC